MKVGEARRLVHAAANEWPEEDVIRLAHVVSLGRPEDVLHGRRLHTLDNHTQADGEKDPRAATSAAEWAVAEVAGMWRSVAAWCGRPLPAPGSVRAALKAAVAKEHPTLETVKAKT